MDEDKRTDLPAPAQTPAAKPAAPDGRQARLAQALRANLRRRKAAGAATSDDSGD